VFLLLLAGIIEFGQAFQVEHMETGDTIGRRSNRQGAVMVLACVCLILTVGFLAFSIDFGYIVVTEGEPQSAADSAALSAAAALPADRESVVNVAATWAAKNIAGGEPMSGSSHTDSYRSDVGPKNLQLNVMGSKCVISGGSEFYGIVYAPTAKVERSGDSDYFGSIVAKQLVLSGSGGLHGDESLDMSGGWGRATLVE
jgi:hypothetical protein